MWHFLCLHQHLFNTRDFRRSFTSFLDGIWKHSSVKTLFKIDFPAAPSNVFFSSLYSVFVLKPKLQWHCIVAVCVYIHSKWWEKRCLSVCVDTVTVNMVRPQPRCRQDKCRWWEGCSPHRGLSDRCQGSRHACEFGKLIEKGWGEICPFFIMFLSAEIYIYDCSTLWSWFHRHKCKLLDELLLHKGSCWAMWSS